MFSNIPHTHTKTHRQTGTVTHICIPTHAYTHTPCEHRLTRETWAQRQSVTTSRKEKILEDRQGRFRDPDASCQKLPLYSKPSNPASAHPHNTRVSVKQLILSLTKNVCTLFAREMCLFKERDLERKTRNLLLSNRAGNLP